MTLKEIVAAYLREHGCNIDAVLRAVAEAMMEYYTPTADRYLAESEREE